MPFTGHQISGAPEDIRLPVLERLTAGAYLYADRNPDSLGQIAKAINDLFNWFRPTLIHDRPRGNYWTAGTSSTLVGQYRVPMWHSGVGGDSDRQGVEMKAVLKGNSGSSAVDVYADVKTNVGIQTGHASRISLAFGEATDAWKIHDGDDFVEVDVRLSIREGGTLAECREFRIDWSPRTDHLLAVDSSGKYGGLRANPFLPCDASHLRTNYAAGSVERVRRMLVDVQELLLRRTPQMITTWSDLANPLFSSGGASNELVRLETIHPPFVNYVEVHMLCQGEYRVKIGPWIHEFSNDDWLWRSFLIPVNEETEPEFTVRQFRIFRTDGVSEDSIKSLCAWWRSLP